MGIEMDEETIPVVSTVVKTESIKEVGTERSMKAGTENIEEMRRKMKDEDKFSRISTGSGAAETEAEPGIEVFKSAMKNNCFIRDTLLNDLKDEYELDSGSVFIEKVVLVLANPPYSTRVERAQSDSAQDVLYKRDVDDAVRLVSSGMAFGAQGRIFCSD